VRQLLVDAGVAMLVVGVGVLVVAVVFREIRVVRRGRVDRALAAVIAEQPTGRLSRRVRRSVLVELADLFQQDTLEARAPGVRLTAAEATADLRSRRWLRRARGLRTLQSLGLTVDELLTGLHDRDGRVRAQAAVAAVGRAEPEVLDALVGLLTDRQPYVRFTALDAVSRRSAGTAAAIARALDAAALLTYADLPASERAVADADAAATRAVRDLADHDEAVGAAGAPARTERVSTGVVAVALASSEATTPGQHGTLPRPLRATTVGDVASRTLVLLLRGASTTADVTTLPAVRRFVVDVRPEVRAAAVEALAALGADPEELVRLLEDEDGRVRAAAVAAVGRSGDRSLAGPVAARLTDRDHGVRQAAAAALAGLGAAGSLLLRAALTGSDPYAADAARSALGLPPTQR
jgi:HEAT repeat protein